MAFDLVAQLGARLDGFQSAMAEAGNMADQAVSRIEGAFDGINPGFGGFASFGAIIAGATGAVGVLFAALKNINSELADIGKNAEYVGVSTDRFQQIKFAATQGGVSSSDATTDLKKAADLLADAKNNENSLTRILDANNIKYKDRNGDVINLNQLLKSAADLLGRFDSIPEKTKAAQMLGLSQGWVDALKGGSTAFENVAASADQAGAVIDKATIAKAQNFDAAWKKSADQLSYQFKAATADVASYLDDLVDRAGKLIDGLNLAANVKAGSGQETFNALADAISIAAKDAAGLPQDLEQVTRVLDHYKASANVDAGIVAGLEEVQAKAKAAAEQLAAVAKLASGLSFPDGVPTPAARPAAADDKTGDGKLPVRKSGSDARDQFEIAVDSVTKHTATLKADTAAVFENNAAQAQFRAEFQELTAIMRDNGEVTQAQIDKYESLRGSMSAQQALEQSGISLTNEHKDAFLASSQAIGQATTAYDKAKESLTKINSASAQVGSALSSAFADAVVEGKSLGDILTSLAKQLEKMAINDVFGSFFNAPASGGKSMFASVISSLIPGFASGTDSAPGGPAWVGENGKELVNLPRGSQVIPNDVVRGMGGTTIQVASTVDARGSNFTEAQLQSILDLRDRNLSRQINAVAPGRNQRYSQLGT
jgi:hypothetical protein